MNTSDFKTGILEGQRCRNVPPVDLDREPHYIEAMFQYCDNKVFICLPTADYAALNIPDCQKDRLMSTTFREQTQFEQTSEMMGEDVAIVQTKYRNFIPHAQRLFVLLANHK